MSTGNRWQNGVGRSHFSYHGKEARENGLKGVKKSGMRGGVPIQGQEEKGITFSGGDEKRSIALWVGWQKGRIRTSGGGHFNS